MIPRTKTEISRYSPGFSLLSPTIHLYWSRCESAISTLHEKARNDELNPEIATVIWLASEGLWFLEMLDIPSIEGESRERVQQTLIELASPTEESR